MRRPAESINRLKPRNTLVDCTFEANLPPDGDAHMKISWLGLVLLVAPLVALLVAPVVAWPQDQAPIGVSGAYRVGPGDVVQITVFEVAELSQPAVVTQQGSIPLPLVGEVGVEGLTTSEIESKLTSLYSQDLLRNPQISVRVEEFRSQPVSILGAVREPGVYQLQGRRRLLDVLAIAGGLSPEVGETITISRLGVQHPGVRRPMSGEVDSPQSPPSVQLVHLLDAEDRLGRREELRVSVRGLLTGAAGEAGNPLVEPHDVVQVAKAGVVYVLGAVKQPGGFPIKDQEKVTVLRALSLAAGLNGNAALQKARIIHQIGAEKIEVPVAVRDILRGRTGDVELETNDILYIPDSRAKNALSRGSEAAVQMATGLVIWRR